MQSLVVSKGLEVGIPEPKNAKKPAGDEPASWRG